MKHLLTIATAAFLLVFAGTAYAQSSTENWQNFTSGFMVTTYAEDNTNYYFGTKGGLVQISKTEDVSTVNNRANSQLPSNLIESIVVDSKDNIWIGTYDAGVVSVENGNWQTMNKSNSDLPSDVIYSLSLDKSEDLWISCEGGMWKKEGESFVQTDTAGVFLWSPEAVLFDEAKGHSWYISGHSVIQYDGTQYIDHSNEVKQYGIDNIYIDAAGNIWVTSSSMLSLYDGTTWTEFSHFEPNGIPGEGSYYGADIDNNGIFTVIRGVDILKYTAGSWQQTALADLSFNGGYVTDMFYDENGMLWIVTSEKVHHQTVTGWESYEISNAPFKSNYMRNIEADNTGKAWASDLSSTIYEYDGKSWSIMNKPSEFTSTNITSIKWYDGKLYFATETKGLYLYENGSWTSYNTSNSKIPTNSIWEMDIDPNTGVIYMGSEEHGLITFDGTNFSMFNTTLSNIPSNKIYGLHAGENGNVWLTFDVPSFSKFDGTTFTNHSQHDLYGSYGRPYGMYEDETGVLWFGTATTPLASFDGDKVTIHETNDPDINGHDIMGIEKDAEGNLWAYTLSELIKFKNGEYTFYTYDNSPVTGSEARDIALNGNTIWLATVPQTYSAKGSGGITVLTNKTSTSVNSKASDHTETMKIYPNPVVNNATVLVDVKQRGNADIRIYNSAGQEIKSLSTQLQAGKQQLDLEVNGLSSGLYFIRLLTNGQVYQSEFIISK